MDNISFSRLGKHGRIGNQLFQIASTIGLAEHYGVSASFPEWEYEPLFEVPLPHGVLETNRVDEKNFHHYDWELTENCDIFGYLQSEKYFGKHKLKFKEEFLQSIKEKVPAGLFDRPLICIQVRRGDYVNNPNYYQIPIAYYLDALITHFPKWENYNIVIVSDDMEYCRVHFECIPNCYFPTHLTDIEQMALASLCEHFILANSSFGWWCAWLGEKENSKIIHSGHLQAGELAAKSDEKDYYPERWISHKKDSYKIDLMDVTFTLPIFYDHADRKNNLDMSLFLLQTSLQTNYIVCEQGGDRFSYTAQWARYIQSESHFFHRTKMLNDMCELAHTEYIVNWDCDVIIPPIQLYMAVKALRDGADVVFPYDGRFARMPRLEWFAKLQKTPDIGIARDVMFKGREPEHNSVGGAVMFSKEAFIEGGLENENMISFGPEDAERNDRFTLLGYDVQRIKGTLFHIDHYVGINSSRRNPYFDANHRELDKMRLMTAEEMRAYVDTWPWRHPYTQKYYQGISEGAIASAKIVMNDLPFRVKTVIDIGCGLGEWNNNNPHYEGVDFHVNPDDLLIPKENYTECDFNKAWIGKTGEKYDLAICLEVAEHLKPKRSEGLIQMLCSLSDNILFSAAIPFQGGRGHINEHWQSWWAELFLENGFGPHSYQPNIRDHKGVELWYRNNIVLYERVGSGYAKHGHVEVQDFVLPEYYIQIVGNLKSRKG